MARQHARVADRVVDLAEARLVALELGARTAAGRGEAGQLAPGLELVLDGAHQRVDAAGVAERVLGDAGVARLERAREPLERAPELREHGLGGAAGAERGVGREEEGGHGERDAAADHALDDAVGREAVGRARVERDEQDRRHARLDHEQLTAAEGDGGGHGEHDEHADLPRAGADQLDEQVGHGEAEHDAADELQRTAGPLAVGRAHGDHRGDGGERRPRVGQQQHREVPRDDSRGGGLHDREPAPAQARAGRRQWEMRVDGRTIPLTSSASST